MDGGDGLAPLIRAFHVMRLGMMVDVATCTIFIWDCLLTFSMEVDLVWKSKWNFMKGLYLFQRYLPLVDTVWRIPYGQTGGSWSKAMCRNLYYSTGVMTLVGIAASEMILALRTWAVWNRNQRLSVILPILYVLVWGSGVVAICSFLNSMIFSDPPYPGFKGCFLTYTNKKIVFVWVQLISWDTLMLALMLVPGVRVYRSGGNSALMKAVYHDGVIYYLYLFVLSLINIFVVAILPVQYQQLLSSMERVLHSMLTSRVVLHMRAQAGDNLVHSEQLTDIQFLSRRGISESRTRGCVSDSH